MTVQMKLDLLNKLPLEVIYGGEDLTVVTPWTEDARMTALQLGKDESWIKSNLNVAENEIDITALAFDFGATRWTGSRFVYDPLSEAFFNMSSVIKEYAVLEGSDRPLPVDWKEDAIARSTALIQQLKGHELTTS